MSDWRSCCLCGKEVDIEVQGTQVFGGRGGRRTTVIDPQGQAHVVTTRYFSERKRNQAVRAAKSAEEKQK